jgi:membrane protein implicated in regulation of membrane protease activity
MAVGVGRSDVVALVLTHGLRLALLGLLVGTALALFVVGGLRALLSDVQSLDAVTLAVVAMILLWCLWPRASYRRSARAGQGRPTCFAKRCDRSP